MPTTISNIKPVEGGTALVSAALYDEGGLQPTPVTVKWSLFRTDGTPIREDVAMTPANPLAILLSGDDLAVFADDNFERVLLVEITYNSTNGDDLTLNDELTFMVQPLVGIS
jgi:hypothetical protein